jgi:hypothetical protein
MLGSVGLAGQYPGAERWSHEDRKLPVPKLMGHGEGQRQACVFIDVAAAVWLAHARHVRQAQGFAGVVHSSTQVLPAQAEKRCQADLV